MTADKKLTFEPRHRRRVLTDLAVSKGTSNVAGVGVRVFPRRPLTLRQEEVLAIIKCHVQINGFAPTRAELAKSLSVSLTCATFYLQALQRKGYLKLTAKTARGIVLADGIPDLEIR